MIKISAHLKNIACGNISEFALLNFGLYYASLYSSGVWALQPFNLALEANDLGRILDLNLALLLLLNLGLGLVVGVESKSTLVIRGLLHTQHIVKCLSSG